MIVFFPAFLFVEKVRTWRPGRKACCTRLAPVSTTTSTEPGLPSIAAAETWYVVPGALTETVAPKCCPWLRERAAWTEPPPVQTSQSRSCVSTVSAACGSPPVNDPRKYGVPSGATAAPVTPPTVCDCVCAGPLHVCPSSVEVRRATPCPFG